MSPWRLGKLLELTDDSGGMDKVNVLLSDSCERVSCCVERCASSSGALHLCASSMVAEKMRCGLRTPSQSHELERELELD